jgi:hypothetical protein
MSIKSAAKAVTSEIESPLLTEAEAAKYLRISPRTLWTLRKEQKVIATLVGRKVFYRQANLDRFITENETRAQVEVAA